MFYTCRIKKSISFRNSWRKLNRFCPLQFSKLAKNWPASQKQISIRFHPKSLLNMLTSNICWRNVKIQGDYYKVCFSRSRRISESNAICAPLAWQIGDLRRPYPTDIEMRLGFLGKSDLNINGGPLQQQSSLNDLHRNSSGGSYSLKCISVQKIKSFLSIHQH